MRSRWGIQAMRKGTFVFNRWSAQQAGEFKAAAKASGFKVTVRRANAGRAITVIVE